MDKEIRLRESCFNSIVVRLKGEWLAEYAMDLNKFQFHSGSIKRATGQAVWRCDLHLFQFHSGSIKR